MNCQICGEEISDDNPVINDECPGCCLTPCKHCYTGRNTFCVVCESLMSLPIKEVDNSESKIPKSKKTPNPIHILNRYIGSPTSSTSYFINELDNMTEKNFINYCLNLWQSYSQLGCHQCTREQLKVYAVKAFKWWNQI